MPEAADSLAEIRAMNRSRGPSCQTGVMLAAMDPKLADTVRKALADDGIEFKALSRWLERKRGMRIGAMSLSRHQRGDCKCE